VDTSASDSGYLDNKDIDNKVLETLELELFIISAIKEQVRKNNMLVAAKMKKKSAKKAQIFKEGWIVTLAIPKKMRLSVKLKRILV